MRPPRRLPLPQSLADTAKQAGKSEEETAALLAACREKLFEARKQRPRPHRDDKVVAAWNGMAISALATAARVLATEQPPAQREFPVEGRPPNEYLDAALRVSGGLGGAARQRWELRLRCFLRGCTPACLPPNCPCPAFASTSPKAAAFARQHLYDSERRTLRRAFTRGPAPVDGFADDYAFMVQGLLDLYAATGDVAHLQARTGGPAAGGSRPCVHRRHRTCAQRCCSPAAPAHAVPSAVGAGASGPHG